MANSQVNQELIDNFIEGRITPEGYKAILLAGNISEELLIQSISKSLNQSQVRKKLGSSIRKLCKQNTNLLELYKERKILDKKISKCNNDILRTQFETSVLETIFKSKLLS